MGMRQGSLKPIPSGRLEVICPHHSCSLHENEFVDSPRLWNRSPKLCDT